MAKKKKVKFYSQKREQQYNDDSAVALKTELEGMIDSLDEAVAQKVWHEFYIGLEDGGFTKEDTENWTRNDIEVFIDDVRNFWNI